MTDISTEKIESRKKQYKQDEVLDEIINDNDDDNDDEDIPAYLEFYIW